MHLTSISLCFGCTCAPTLFEDITRAATINMHIGGLIWQLQVIPGPKRSLCPSPRLQKTYQGCQQLHGRGSNEGCLPLTPSNLGRASCSWWMEPGFCPVGDLHQHAHHITCVSVQFCFALFCSFYCFVVGCLLASCMSLHVLVNT